MDELQRASHVHGGMSGARQLYMRASSIRLRCMHRVHFAFASRSLRAYPTAATHAASRARAPQLCSMRASPAAHAPLSLSAASAALRAARQAALCAGQSCTWCSLQQ
jgi:hypothetical protein